MKVELTFYELVILERSVSFCLDKALDLPESDDTKKFVNRLYAMKVKLNHLMYEYIKSL